MKNIKKLTLVTLLSAGVIFTAACSQVANQTTEKKAEQKQETKLSNEEILKKSIEAFKNLKSFQEDESGESFDQSIDAPNAQFKTYKRTFIADVSNLNYKEEATDSASYKIGNEIYSQNKGQAWRKSTVKSTPEKQKENILKFPLEHISKYNKDYTINQTDTAYIVEFKPSNLKEFASILYSDKPESVKNNYTLEQYTSKITLDKTTLLPISDELEYKGNIDLSGEKTTFHYKTSITYSNYNSVAPIQLPEEAKK